MTTRADDTSGALGGADTRAVLAQFGYRPEEIDQLIASGAVVAGP